MHNDTSKLKISLIFVAQKNVTPPYNIQRFYDAVSFFLCIKNALRF